MGRRTCITYWDIYIHLRIASIFSPLLFPEHSLSTIGTGMGEELLTLLRQTGWLIDWKHYHWSWHQAFILFVFFLSPSVLTTEMISSLPKWLLDHLQEKGSEPAEESGIRYQLTLISSCWLATIPVQTIIKPLISRSPQVINQNLSSC